ncbi:MAG: transporter, partial [Microbacteriaceae bacterium]|nr:transporter [Microbacteriaceae bacterium]
GRILVPVGVAIAIVGFVLVLLAAVSFPPGLAPWYIAAAMSVAGFGTGLVISPNQAITLSDVPVTQAGVAGSMTQLGQRVGNAIGFAAVVSTFYSVIHSETGKATTLVTFHDGLRNGLLVVFGLFVLTLIVALVDLIGYRRRRAAATSALD